MPARNIHSGSKQPAREKKGPGFRSSARTRLRPDVRPFHSAASSCGIGSPSVLPGCASASPDYITSAGRHHVGRNHQEPKVFSGVICISARSTDPLRNVNVRKAREITVVYFRSVTRVTFSSDRLPILDPVLLRGLMCRTGGNDRERDSDACLQAARQ